MFFDWLRDVRQQLWALRFRSVRRKAPRSIRSVQPLESRVLLSAAVVDLSALDDITPTLDTDVVEHSALTYTITNDTVTITDCDTAATGTLVIPSTIEGKTVTSIGNDAFSYCSRLTSMTLPDSVTSIGNYTFGNCSSLTSITLPDSVISIGDSAFQSCTSLTSITLPDSVISIGNDAFNGCTSLTSVTVGNLIEGNRLSEILKGLNDLSQITSLTISNGVTSIEVGAFEYCSNLTSITLPDSVTSIGDGAFYGCTSLTSITLPDSVTSIGEAAFVYCSSLTSITLPDNVISIGAAAFAGCTGLTSVTLWGNAPSVGSNMFDGVHADAKVYIQTGATGYGATFGGLPVVIPDASLTDIALDNAVTSLGEDSDTSSATNVVVLAGTDAASFEVAGS